MGGVSRCLKERSDAVRVVLALRPGHRLVTILCDSGHKYPSRLFSPQWLAAKGLAQSVRRGALWDWLGGQRT
jgi:cysteine synthase